MAAVGALLALFAAPALAQAPVTVKFPEAGLVSISARNVPLRTILAEWARVGGSRFVNAERVTGGPMTIELVNVTERKAIETLLRGVGGYIVGARASAAPGASTFDRIMLMPTAAPIQRTASSPPPVFSPTPAPFVPSEPDDDTENGGSPARVPTLLQQQLREATERAEVARQNRERERQQDEEDGDDPDQDEDQDAAPQPATTPGPSPFGNVQGSSRPGEVTTPPRRNNRNPED
jgi:hypothetical protein